MSRPNRIAGFVFVAAIVGASCATPAICVLPPGSVPRGAAVDSLEFEVMQRLLLAHDASGATRNDTACNGSPIAFDPEPEQCAVREEPGEPLADFAPSATDLVLAPADGDFWIAYLPVRRSATGVSEGPVGIIRLDDDVLQVRALGVLRTPGSRLNLTLEKVGEHTVLVADGETCVEGQTPCSRVTRLMILAERHFDSAHLETPSGGCLGPALFEREGTRVLRIGPRAEQTFHRSLGLDVVEGHLELAEQIVVEEKDPTDPSRPARVVRRAESLVTLTVDPTHRRFVATGEARWETLLRDAQERAAGTH